MWREEFERAYSEWERMMDTVWAEAAIDEPPMPKPHKELGRPCKGYIQMKRPAYMRRF